jgi:hypothetical protein
MLYLLLAMVALFLAVVGLLVLIDQLVRRNFHCWLPAYLRERSRRRDPGPDEEVHLILCVADHFEPTVTEATPEANLEMVRRWGTDYPRLFGSLRDSDGRPPRHTFFYPLAEYKEAHLDVLAELCRAGYGEVEVHLRHEDDTADELREMLRVCTRQLANRHGLLPVHRQTGALRYGFVHGHGALDNSLPDRKHCGVDTELEVLRETGCYADFTLPSAPSPAQTRTINRIYYAVEDGKADSHETGTPVGTAPAPERGLMLIQGPLLFDWQRRHWGLLPRVENGCLRPLQPPTLDRLKLWLRARIQVPSRPDWFFVKLHTRGGDPGCADLLLGQPMVQFHQALAERARRGPKFFFHYVTAREMYNLAKAAESGWKGSVAEARDFELIWPPPAAPAQNKDQASVGAV